MPIREIKSLSSYISFLHVWRQLKHMYCMGKDTCSSQTMSMLIMDRIIIKHNLYIGAGPNTYTSASGQPSIHQKNPNGFGPCWLFRSSSLSPHDYFILISVLLLSVLPLSMLPVLIMLLKRAFCLLSTDDLDDVFVVPLVILLVDESCLGTEDDWRRKPPLSCSFDGASEWRDSASLADPLAQTFVLEIKTWRIYHVLWGLSFEAMKFLLVLVGSHPVHRNLLLDLDIDTLFISCV